MSSTQPSAGVLCPGHACVLVARVHATKKRDCSCAWEQHSVGGVMADSTRVGTVRTQGIKPYARLFRAVFRCFATLRAGVQEDVNPPPPPPAHTYTPTACAAGLCCVFSLCVALVAVACPHICTIFTLSRGELELNVLIAWIGWMCPSLVVSTPNPIPPRRSHAGFARRKSRNGCWRGKRRLLRKRRP